MAENNFAEIVITPFVIKAWLPNWLDRIALINVDAPGCGTSVVRGPTGHK